ncbi:hypothetical protein D3C81_1823530 [compost metagenome]
MAPVITEQRQLLSGLNALGGDRHAHRIAQVDDRLNHTAVTCALAQRLNETFVYLDAVERISSQVAQGRITGTKVIHVQANPQFL